MCVPSPFGPLKGEAAFSALGFFQHFPTLLQRYIKSGTFTLNSIRRAVGVPQQDYEEEEEEEEEEVVVAKKPAAKAAKTNPSTTGTATTKGSGKKGAKAAASAAAAAAETERRSSGVFAYISNLFLPSKE